MPADVFSILLLVVFVVLLAVGRKLVADGTSPRVANGVTLMVLAAVLAPFAIVPILGFL